VVGEAFSPYSAESAFSSTLTTYAACSSETPNYTAALFCYERPSAVNASCSPTLLASAGPQSTEGTSAEGVGARSRPPAFPLKIQFCSAATHVPSGRAAASRPDEVNGFKLPNPPGRTRPWSSLSPNRNEYQKQRKMFLGSRAWPVHSADNLTAICEPTV
jgi:hypothetical protein